MAAPLPSRERVKKLLVYDAGSGDFWWRGRQPRLPVPAGSIKRGDAGTGGGYLIISVDGRQCRAHRLAWLYMTGDWPPADVDHIDGNRLNNRWTNLRLASRGQNLANKKFEENRNTTGFKGVSLTKNGQRWAAFIKKDRKSRFLGHYNTPEEAHAAYCLAAHELFGEFARPR